MAELLSVEAGGVGAGEAVHTVGTLPARVRSGGDVRMRGLLLGALVLGALVLGALVPQPSSSLWTPRFPPPAGRSPAPARRLVPPVRSKSTAPAAPRSRQHLTSAPGQASSRGSSRPHQVDWFRAPPQKPALLAPAPALSRSDCRRRLTTSPVRVTTCRPRDRSQPARAPAHPQDQFRRLYRPRASRARSAQPLRRRSAAKGKCWPGVAAAHCRTAAVRAARG